MRASSKRTKVAILVFLIVVLTAVGVYVFFMLNPNFARQSSPTNVQTNASNQTNVQTTVNTESIGSNLAGLYAALTIAVPAMIAVLVFILFIATTILQSISFKITDLTASVNKLLDSKDDHINQVKVSTVNNDVNNDSSA